MTWYYSDGEKQLGPVSGEQLVELRRSGIVTADSLVWKEGMANWAPYSEAGPAVNLDALPPITDAPPVVPVPPIVKLSGSEAVCVECGKIFPKDEMIAHGQAYVCANCKPVFVQKLSEGARVGGISSIGGVPQLRYAGFWLRLGAKLVDNILLRVVGFVIGFLLAMVAASSKDSTAMLGVQLFSLLFELALMAAYNIFMIGKFGATLGKMACKIQVVNANGTPLSYGKATGRFFAEILSGCPTLTIGYIIAGFDEEKRALHDRICDTRVVFKDGP